MGLNDISHSFGHGAGSFVGTTRKVLAWPVKTLRKLWPQSSTEKIRTIVAEELARLIAGQTELTGTELQKRLQVMAETIPALQERFDELAARGPVSEAEMFKVMRSLKTAASLTDDERAILANVFRQNIAIQKPELIDTAVEQNSLKMMSS